MIATGDLLAAFLPPAPVFRVGVNPAVLAGHAPRIIATTIRALNLKLQLTGETRGVIGKRVVAGAHDGDGVVAAGVAGEKFADGLFFFGICR